jgi:hypothetical protein
MSHNIMGLHELLQGMSTIFNKPVISPYYADE